MNYLLGGLFLIVAFVVWRYLSVARGARKRDQALLQMLAPVAQQLLEGRPVDATEVRRLAQQPAPRILLHRLLHETGHAELFPPELLTRRGEAESVLARWLIHPNELQNAPSELELVEIVERPFRASPVEVYVFRYKMPPGHWAGAEWILGLAGPFFAADAPFASLAGGFSRARAGAVEPGEFVDWYLKVLDQRLPPA